MTLLFFFCCHVSCLYRHEKLNGLIDCCLLSLSVTVLDLVFVFIPDTHSHFNGLFFVNFCRFLSDEAEIVQMFFVGVFVHVCVRLCMCWVRVPPPSPTCFKLYWVWVQCACVRVCVCESSLVMFLYLKTLSIIVVNNNLFFYCHGI